ncbi:MAG: MFS transporter, partial [Solirubrobacteraceae bacterium]
MSERAGRPFLILTVAFFTLLLGSNLPTPLYAVYRERFGFSSAVLTLVFATYMVVLVPTLLLCGQLSDRVGRKRVIAAGLVTAAAGLGLFAAATATAWLFAARAVQGLSVGMVTSAATAGLVELEPHGDRERAALYAVIVWRRQQRRAAARRLARAVGARAARALLPRGPRPRAPGRGRRPDDPRARDGRRPLARAAAVRAAGDPSR